MYLGWWKRDVSYETQLPKLTGWRRNTLALEQVIGGVALATRVKPCHAVQVELPLANNYETVAERGRGVAIVICTPPLLLRLHFASLIG